jgi:hypothetical protein
MKEKILAGKGFAALTMILIMSATAALYADDVKDNVEVTAVQSDGKMYANIQNYNPYAVEIQISFHDRGRGNKPDKTRKTIVTAGETKRLEIDTAPGNNFRSLEARNRARAAYNRLPESLKIDYVKPL